MPILKKAVTVIIEGNARRFINAYNKIDACLRSVYGIKVNTSFTDLIRRCSQLDYVVRSNQTVLVDYARLRNAIVHRSTEDYVIAEPHANVTQNIERIASLICAPPLAITRFKKQNVITFSHDQKLIAAIKKMAETRLSNIPVYKNNSLLGVLNNKIIVQKLGIAAAASRSLDKFVSATSVESVLSEDYFATYYALCDKNATMQYIVNLFSENRRQLAVIMTNDGTRLSAPVCVITAYDALQMAEVLDDYNTL